MSTDPAEALFKDAEKVLARCRELDVPDDLIARMLVGMGRSDPYVLQLFYSVGYGKGSFEQRCGYPREEDEISGDVAVMLRDYKNQRPN